MMSINMRRGWLWTTLAAAALLFGVGGLTPHAYAQKDKDETKSEKTDKTTDKTESKGYLVIGDNSIDPNQPIKSEFRVSVSVVGEQEPSAIYVVDASGNINIKYAGITTPVMVKGLTPDKAAKEIEKFLKTYIKNPQVTVSIVDVPRPVVYIGGAVKTPGPVFITTDTTLADLLSKAEWTENADLSQVRVTRKSKKEGEKAISTMYAFDKYIKGQEPDEGQNPVLQDKDRVWVPLKFTTGNGIVSVGGEVTKPSLAIPLRTNPPMTIREVINLVGGTTQAANRQQITIRRPGIERPLIINLDKAEQGDFVNNIEIKGDDAIYVERLENNAYINMNGGFVKVGKLVYDKRTTLSQAIMEAGGIAPFSKEKDGKIFRHPDGDPKNTRVIAFDWTKIAKGTAPDIELLPGDSVWVGAGQPPQKFDIFSAINILTSGAYLFNSLSGRYYR